MLNVMLRNGKAYIKANTYIVAIIGMAWWFRKEIHSGMLTEDEDKIPMSVAAFMFGPAAITAALLYGVPSASKAIKAVVAPRVVLAEKISEFTK